MKAKPNLRRKEVKFMKYEKPELTLLGFASDAIQSTVKGLHHIDSVDFPTAAAYEADE
jgi:hypothetical protein